MNEHSNETALSKLAATRDVILTEITETPHLATASDFQDLRKVIAKIQLLTTFMAAQ